MNQRYSIQNGRNLLSRKYREAKEAIQWEIAAQWKGEPFTEEVTLNVMQYYGDKRKRDIDCYLKLLLDSMTGIVYHDDSLVTEMHVFKEVDIDNPRIIIQVL